MCAFSDMSFPDTCPPYDLSRFVQWAGGDVQQIRHIGGIFCETLATALLQFRQAFEASDVAGVRRTAHDIKNCLVLVAAREAIVTAEIFEDILGFDDEGVAQAAASRLEASTSTVLRAVAALIGDGP